MVQKDPHLALQITGPAKAIAALPDGPLMEALSPGAGEWEPLVLDDMHAPALFTGDNGVIRDAVHEATYACDRWQTRSTFRNSVLDVKIDLGAAKFTSNNAPVSLHPVSKLQLGLVEGSARDLFSAAKLFLAQDGFKLDAYTTQDTLNNATHHGPVIVARRKKPFIYEDDTARDAMKRALKINAERIIALQNAIVEARAAEGVHQMRVELRRFRAIEQSCRPIATSKTLQRLAERARLYGRILGPARDWDVFLDKTLVHAESFDYNPEGLQYLRLEARRRRADAWVHAVALIASDEFRAFTLALLRSATLARWTEVPAETDEDTPKRKVTFDAPVKDFATLMLSRALRQAKNTANLIEFGDPATRHPLRVALKKLRYNVQIFRNLYDKDARKSYMETMSALQDRFGDINDAVVAQHLALETAQGGGAEAMRAAGLIMGFHAAKAEQAAGQIDAAWQEFENRTPFWQE